MVPSSEESRHVMVRQFYIDLLRKFEKSS